MTRADFCRRTLVLVLATAALLGAVPVSATAQEGGKFDINFTNMALEDVVKTYAKWMGKNFLLTDKLKGAQITIYSEKPVTKGEAWRVFEAILKAHGYTIVPGDEVNRIIPIQDSVSDLIPTYSTEGLVYGSRSHSFVTRLFPLEHVGAAEIKGIIQKFLTKGGDVTEYTPTNLLIVTDSSAIINRVIKILRELDVPATRQEMELIPIRYAEAQEMATLVDQIMVGGGAAAPAARGRRGRQPAAPTGGEGGPSVITVERLNSLLVMGSRSEIDEVKRLLEMLDVDVGEAATSEENIYVHYLEYADAEELSGTLQSLISGVISAKEQDERRLTGSSLEQSAERRRLAQLQETAAGTPTGDAAQTLAAAQFESEIRIAPDTATNSMLITATRRDYETLRKVIEKLDLPRRQVFVEAAILEVQVNDAVRLGFSAFGALSVGDGIIFGQQAVGGPPSPVALAQGDTGIQALQGLGGLSGGVIGPTEEVDLDGDGTTDLNVPTYGGIVSAAKSDRSVNVLSTPTVLTSDNEQAQIIVANNVPIPTGQTVGTSGVTTSTISREDIGITLRLTPQINEGDTLRLEIFVEISNVAQGSFGIDINQSGIVTTVRSAETVVSVKDRQPIVIGGLIQDSDNLNENKVPILGDIPLLGALFRDRNKVRDKQNLIIVITPQIVRDHFDATRVMALEVEKRQPVLESDLLLKWLDEKNTSSAQEAFRRPPDEDRLPNELEAGELLITPEGVYTPETYNTLKQPEDGEVRRGGEALGPLEGLRRRPDEQTEGSTEPGQAGDTASQPEVQQGAGPQANQPEQPAPVDPEEVRRQILELRERRREAQQENQ